MRSTLVGAALAGVVSVVVLTALTTAELASPTVRIVIAVILGVGIAQVYERTRQ
jgi:hypothetical protein